MPNRSDLVLRFFQPALARCVCASSSPPPLPGSREENRPAFPTPALSGPSTLFNAWMPDPEPRRPGSAGTDQRSDPGPRGQGAPVPSGWVPPLCYGCSTEGMIWSQRYANDVKRRVSCVDVHHFITFDLHHLRFYFFFSPLQCLSDRVFPNRQCTKCCRLWRSKDQSG